MDLARAQERWLRQQRRDRDEESTWDTFGWLFAAVGFSSLLAQPSAGGEGGGQMPGQGNLPGGGFYGGTVNSATGNLNYAVPLVSIPVRGGMSMDLTLYHNSQSSFVGMFGNKWSCTWEMRVTDLTTMVIVRWPDGLTVPYSPTVGGYQPPPGIHDQLVKNQDNTWTVTTKDQTKLHFDANGRMTSMVDRNGNAITLTYSNGDLVAVTSPSQSQTLTFTHQTASNGERRCVSVSDGTRTWSFDYEQNLFEAKLSQINYPLVGGNAYSTQFTYDSYHNLVTETDPKGKVWQWTYASPAGGVIGTFKDPLLNTWTFTFSVAQCALKPPANSATQTIRHNYSNGLLVSVVDPANFSVAMQYDNDRNVVQFVDARGNAWTMTYDANGNLTSLKNPFPIEKTWTFTWNATNDLVSASDPLQHTWNLSYYPDGNLKEIWDPMSPSRRRALIGPYTNGLPSHVKDALDKQWTLGYDPNGYLNAITNPENETVSAVYDSLGRVTQVTNGAGETTKLYYDEWSRIVRVEHPDLKEIQYAYDAASNLISVTDERGKTTSFAYDNAHRLVSVTRTNGAQNETESYSYDGNNRLTSVTNGNGKTRFYGYNVRGELFSISLPDLSTEYFSYDGAGNLTLYTHPAGFQIRYVYDNAGRLTKIDYPTGVDTTFSYDAASRLVQMVDSTGTTTWAYNAADQVTSLAQPAGTITYEYDDNARLWKMHQPGSLTTTYTYDFAWRLKTITNGFGELTSFDYDPASRVIKKSFANGTYETYSYDSRSRVEWIKLFNSSNQLLSQHQYTYDPSSNVLTRTDNGVTTTFGYDDIGQLISESRPGYSASYTYDKNGNRLTRTLNGVYTYDAADKLLNVKVNGIVVKSFTYDLAGRTTGITDAGGTTSFSYDYEDRVTSITRPGMTTNAFAYNGFGARVRKTDSSGTTTYLRSGTSVVAPVVADSGAVYTPGISERRGGASRFYHGDIKNFVEQTDSSGQVVSSQQYDAFGNPVSASGTWSGPFAYGGRFGYQSDSDTSLSLLGHRYYDPSTGRFLSRDPIGDGRNWYVYCEGNPVAFSDPTGLYNKKVADIIRRYLPRKYYDAYRKDKDYADRVHDAIHEERGDFDDDRGRRKPNNPDATPEQVADAARSAWSEKQEREYGDGPDPDEFHEVATPVLPVPTLLPWGETEERGGVDWGRVGAVVGIAAAILIGGAVIIASGGSATPVVGAAAGALLGGVIATGSDSRGGMWL
jgi:RHS repeat-associated protein